MPITSKILKNLCCLFLICNLYSCAHRTNTCEGSQQMTNDTLFIHYATGFKVSYFDNYKEVTIKNPWQKDKNLATYYLVNNDTISTPDDTRKIVVPLQKIAVTSCTHFEFLNLIGELSTVNGICNPEIVYNAEIKSNYVEEKITNIGDAFNVNIEKLLVTAPDALMVATYNQQDENLQRLQAAGIPLIYNNEWTENTALARAEWLKLVATFYDKEELACQIFDKIDSRYNAAKLLVGDASQQPKIMAGGNFKGTWYMPSGHSYMGQLFVDAGTDYYYKDSKETGSLPLNFEVVLNNFSEADIWLNAPTQTIDELFSMDERHKLFQAAKSGNVYGFYARTSTNGANDFWESAVARPDIVLKDLIWATHPEIMADYEPTYIMKLK